MLCLRAVKQDNRNAFETIIGRQVPDPDISSNLDSDGDPIDGDLFFIAS